MKRDESFTDFFTLSTFRKDILIAAAKHFASEYAIVKKVLGPHCKLYCQKSWNTNTWMELAETESLIRLLTDQMSKSKRVTATRVLVLRISFGKSKRGFEFKDESLFFF